MSWGFLLVAFKQTSNRVFSIEQSKLSASTATCAVEPTWKTCHICNSWNCSALRRVRKDIRLSTFLLVIELDNLLLPGGQWTRKSPSTWRYPRWPSFYSIYKRTCSSPHLLLELKCLLTKSSSVLLTKFESVWGRFGIKALIELIKSCKKKKWFEKLFNK